MIGGRRFSAENNTRRRCIFLYGGNIIIVNKKQKKEKNIDSPSPRRARASGTLSIKLKAV